MALFGGILGAVIYTALAIWSYKKPFAAIVTGFLFYVTLIVISAIDNPVSIIQGIIWKVLIISAFVYGYKGVKESEKLTQELEDLSAGQDLNSSDEPV